MPLPIDVFRPRALSLPTPVILNDNRITQHSSPEAPKFKSAILKKKKTEAPENRTMFVR